MKVRTSVTLPKDLLVKVDALAGKKRRRSKIVEFALSEYIAKQKTEESVQHDVEIINRNADLINRQVKETLEFQAEW